MATERLMRFRPTYGNIWGVTWPLILAGISETVIDVTDTIFLAYYGTAELAAIGVADSVYGLSLFLIIGLVEAALEGEQLEAVCSTSDEGLGLLDEAIEISDHKPSACIIKARPQAEAPLVDTGFALTDGNRSYTATLIEVPLAEFAAEGETE